MSRRVIISGLGPISGLGIGLDANWAKLCAGESALDTIQVFDPTGFTCQVAAEVEPYKIARFVPKSHRKATKVMARDIELAVIAADQAARDAELLTPGTANNGEDYQRTYEAERVGCQIGAGLIAADLDELTDALWTSRDSDNGGELDLHKWGREGMNHLTPLWLLKYLPNMLACHVTIIHDSHGPSNTITCSEASGALSLSESVRVIQRGAADVCFCGGVESKLNPMSYFRQELTGRLTSQGNDQPKQAVRPFDKNAAGTALGEGGGIVILEALDTFEQREEGKAYCEVIGCTATQTVNPQKLNREPNEDGRSIAAAIRGALADAGQDASQIDLIVPFACGTPRWDRAEVAALNSVFGDRLAEIPILAAKSAVGNCGAGAGGLDLVFAAMALHTQTVPQPINRDNPLPGISNTGSADKELNGALVYSVGFGGQNVAVILKRFS